MPGGPAAAATGALGATRNLASQFQALLTTTASGQLRLARQIKSHHKDTDGSTARLWPKNVDSQAVLCSGIPQDNKRLLELLAQAEQRAEDAACDAVRASAAAADARAELATRPAIQVASFHAIDFLTAIPAWSLVTEECCVHGIHPKSMPPLSRCGRQAPWCSCE